jgi:hypothetical protein
MLTVGVLVIDGVIEGVLAGDLAIEGVTVIVGVKEGDIPTKFLFGEPIKIVPCKSSSSWLLL